MVRLSYIQNFANLGRSIFKEPLRSQRAESKVVLQKTASVKFEKIISEKVFKSGPNKICGKQLLKNLKGSA